MQANDRSGAANTSRIRVGSDNGCSIYSDEKSSVGLAAAGEDGARPYAAAREILDPSWAKINPDDWPCLPPFLASRSEHIHLDNLSDFDRRPSFLPNTLNHPDPAEAARVRHVIGWLGVGVLLWAGIAWIFGLV